MFQSAIFTKFAFSRAKKSAIAARFSTSASQKSDLKLTQPGKVILKNILQATVANIYELLKRVRKMVQLFKWLTGTKDLE